MHKELEKQKAALRSLVFQFAAILSNRENNRYTQLKKLDATEHYPKKIIEKEGCILDLERDIEQKARESGHSHLQQPRTTVEDLSQALKNQREERRRARPDYLQNNEHPSFKRKLCFED